MTKTPCSASAPSNGVLRHSFELQTKTSKRLVYVYVCQSFAVLFKAKENAILLSAFPEEF